MHKVNSCTGSIGRVLLTRPGDKNHPLAQLLVEHGMETLCCPLIEVTPMIDTGLAEKLACCDIVIGVSDHAVISADSQIDSWPNKDYIAVGHATANAFLHYKIRAILPHQLNTEGMLALPLLSQVNGMNIVILRGNSGRETLAQQLRLRGANVVYSELYRRDAIVQATAIVEQWQQQGVTTIVVTSAEILQILLKLVNNGYKLWLANITIVVPSIRVADIAKALGLINIEIAQGADNQAILNKLINLQSALYDK